MNAVIETLASTESTQDARVARDVLPSVARNFTQPTRPATPPLRQGRERWSSSLCRSDLQSLLQIIESDLIPQLLNSYSPARHAPDGRLISG
jgi:hypothetical protein